MRQPISKHLSSFLDWVRGVCAFLVTIHHVRMQMFVDYKDLPARDLFLSGFYFVTLFGRAPVIIFFVLSGYLVGGALMKREITSRNIVRYLSDRLTRLYIVLVPALILSGALILLCRSTGAHSDAYPLGFHVLLGNFLFLQTIAVPTYAGNEPLWSLANEFWYYVLFPLVAVACVGTRDKLYRWIAGGAALGMLALLPGEIAVYFVHWLVGVGAHFLRCGRMSPYLVAGVLAVAAAGSRIYFPRGNWTFDLLVACSAACTIAAFAQSRASHRILERTAGFASGLSAFSFSLYVLHMPFLIFTLAVLGITEPQVPTAHNMAVYFSIIAAIYVMAWLFACYTERRTKVVRDWIASLSFRPNEPRVRAAE